MVRSKVQTLWEGYKHKIIQQDELTYSMQKGDMRKIWMGQWRLFFEGSHFSQGSSIRGISFELGIGNQICWWQKETKSLLVLPLCPNSNAREILFEFLILGWKLRILPLATRQWHCYYHKYKHLFSLGEPTPSSFCTLLSYLLHIENLFYWGSTTLKCQIRLLGYVQLLKFWLFKHSLDFIVCLSHSMCLLDIHS